MSDNRGQTDGQGTPGIGPGYTAIGTTGEGLIQDLSIPAGNVFRGDVVEWANDKAARDQRQEVAQMHNAELRERQRQEALRTSTVNPPRQEKPILTYRRFLGTNPDDCFGEGSADLVGDFLSILGQRNFPLIKDLISIEKIKVPFVDPYVPISRRVASRGYLIGRGGEVHRHERGSGRYTSLYVCQDGLLREVRRSKAHPVMFGPIAITNAVTPATKNAEVGNWRTSQVKIEDTSDNILRRPDSVGSIDEFIQLDFRNKLRETLRKVLGLTG